MILALISHEQSPGLQEQTSPDLQAGELGITEREPRGFRASDPSFAGKCIKTGVQAPVIDR